MHLMTRWPDFNDEIYFDNLILNKRIFGAFSYSKLEHSALDRVK